MMGMARRFSWLRGLNFKACEGHPVARPETEQTAVTLEDASSRIKSAEELEKNNSFKTNPDENVTNFT
jgi:hypothetical protein